MPDAITAVSDKRTREEVNEWPKRYDRPIKSSAGDDGFPSRRVKKAALFNKSGIINAVVARVPGDKSLSYIGFRELCGCSNGV